MVSAWVCSNRLVLDQIKVDAKSNENTAWRPSEFRLGLFGCEHQFTFPAVKLLDLAQTSENLTNDTNPFTVIISAYLQANQTRKNQQQRFSRQDLLNLYRFIDWVMGLHESSQADEMWSFVENKGNKQWLRLALDKETCEIVGMYMGKRDHEAAKQRWSPLPAVYRQCSV